MLIASFELQGQVYQVSGTRFEPLEFCCHPVFGVTSRELATVWIWFASVYVERRRWKRLVDK